MNTIVVEDLKKAYGGFLAVKGVSFSIQRGEIFGIIGPNGAGKSTILRSLAGLIGKTSGNMVVLGEPVPERIDKIRKKISYLPEDAGAYKSMTGREYLSFIARVYNKNGEIEETILRGIGIADLDIKIDERVGKYSKGMLRRLLLARSIMIEPEIAILDEPSSGLDILQARTIRELIQKEAGKGTTFVISSHNMLEVEALCNRIAFLDEGRILKIAPPRELKKEYGDRQLSEVFFLLKE